MKTFNGYVTKCHTISYIEDIETEYYFETEEEAMKKHLELSNNFIMSFVKNFVPYKCRTKAKTDVKTKIKSNLFFKECVIITKQKTFAYKDNLKIGD